jgi:mannosyltransferase OCH1-like enzyme
MFSFLARRIRVLHPTWEYRLWTDDDIDHFVRAHFSHYVDAFFALPKKIMRIDVFRYMLMFVHGGVYIDLDYELFKPIEAFVQDCDLLLPAEDDNVDAPNHLAQQLLASAPGHIFWADVIRSVLELPPGQIQRLADPVNDTGPHLVTRVHRRNPSRYAAKVPRRNFFCPEACPHSTPIPKEAYGIHHCAATWRGEGAALNKLDGMVDARWFDQPVF